MRKHVVDGYKMLEAADASVNQTSQPTNVKQLDKASIRVEWTGSPVGELKVDVRHKADAAWYELDFGSVIVIDSTAHPELNHLINLLELPFADIRVRYVSTSGSGTISAQLQMKTTGA